MFAYYLEKLRATPDGDGSLLDHVTIMYGSGMSDGNAHSHHNLPILLAGGGPATCRADGISSIRRTCRSRTCT